MVQAKTALPVKLHIRFRRIRSRSSPRRRASCSGWSISPRHTSIGGNFLYGGNGNDALTCPDADPETSADDIVAGTRCDS